MSEAPPGVTQKQVGSGFPDNGPLVIPGCSLELENSTPAHYPSAGWGGGWGRLGTPPPTYLFSDFRFLIY